MSYRYGTNPEPYPTVLDTIWRYDSGETALAQIESLHENARGYHGTQCMGGSIFVGHDNIKPASVEDNKKWYECAKWRKPTTTANVIKMVNQRNEAIADLIEKALRAEAESLLATHPEIRLICWWMGMPQIVAKHIEDWDGEDVEVEVSYPEFDGRATPPHMGDFFAITDLDDRLYNVITGRPRRYERKPDGSIEQITDW